MSNVRISVSLAAIFRVLGQKRYSLLNKGLTGDGTLVLVSEMQML